MGVDVMASLHKQNGNRPGWKIRWRDVSSRQKALWLGDVSKRSATETLRHLNELVRANEIGTAPDASAEQWALSLTGRLREKLVELGLASPEVPQMQTDAGRRLGPFVDAYIESRCDIKGTTETNYKQTRRLLVEHFGADRILRCITLADAERWRRWMVARPMAVATVSKQVTRAKTIFTEAVKDRLLNTSPCSQLKGGSEANKDRHFFIHELMSRAVLASCPDDDWRLIFGLSRYAGLRWSFHKNGGKTLLASDGGALQESSDSRSKRW
jgi:hypothetical protein